MAPLLLLLICLVLFTPTRAAEPPVVPRFHARLAVALEASQANQVPVLAVFTRDASPACLALMQEVITSTNFQDRAGALHVAEVSLDADEGQAERFEIRSVPTLLLLAPDGRIVARREGRPSLDDMLTWLEQGRARFKSGTWEGTAPPADLAEFTHKAASGQLEETDLQQLLVLLGDADPARRAAVSRFLLGLRERAVPTLLNGLGDPYLGIRLGALETFQKLAPDAPVIDPWGSPAEQRDQLAGLRTWWDKTKRLPAADEARPADPTVAAAVQAALESVRRGEGARQTEGMSTVVGQGRTALPAVREALRQAIRTGDQRTVGLLEDIRWAILIPDALERQSGPLRQVLGRGKGPDRQAAVTRLGRAGADALPALMELLADADSLVVESAVRALSGIGGQLTIPALAAVLKSPDSNLRMASARALGHLKDPAAGPALFRVLDDPNEIVACTALAALEEAHANQNDMSQSCPEEIVKALKPVLSDPRWRVRAAAAGVAGKMRATALVPVLKDALLKDPDAFATKSALQALTELRSPPDGAALMALARRLGSLRGDVVQSLSQRKDSESAASIQSLYNEGQPADRLVVLQQLRPHHTPYGTPERIGTNWQPLLTRAATEPDPRLRRAVAGLLDCSPFPLITNLVSGLLTDPDPDTRKLAALGVLEAVRLSQPRRVGDEDDVDFIGGVDVDEAMDEDSSDALSPPPIAMPNRVGTNAPVLPAELLANWHGALARDLVPTVHPPTGLAHYLTGPDPKDTTVLLQAVDGIDVARVDDEGRSVLMGTLLARLPWPEGRAVADRLEKRPVLYALALAAGSQATEPLRLHLMEPARFRRVMESAPPADFERLVEILLGRPQWSLLQSTPDLARAIAGSERPQWRALSWFAQGQRKDATNTQTFEKVLADPSPYVQLAAAQALARLNPPRDLMERTLGPLLLRNHADLAQVAAVALLEPDTRLAASLQYVLTTFVYESVNQVVNESYVNHEGRPLMPLDRRPAFLDELKQHLPPPERDDAPAIALLLAQYGDPAGLDHCLPPPDQLTQNQRLDTFLTAMGLLQLKSPRHVAFLRGLLTQFDDDWELQKLLQPLRGLQSKEARQLRLDINRRFRQ